MPAIKRDIDHTVRRSLAAAAVLLGLLVALTPRLIFPVCQIDLFSTGSAPGLRMRCFWFAQAELLIGGAIVLTALAAAWRPRCDAAFVAGIVLAGLGAAALLVSFNAVIGSMCAHPGGALCQVGTKPAERIIGTLVIITGLALVAASFAARRGSNTQ